MTSAMMRPKRASRRRRRAAPPITRSDTLLKIRRAAEVPAAPPAEEKPRSSPMLPFPLRLESRLASAAQSDAVVIRGECFPASGIALYPTRGASFSLLLNAPMSTGVTPRARRDETKGFPGSVIIPSLAPELVGTCTPMSFSLLPGSLPVALRPCGQLGVVW